MSITWTGNTCFIGDTRLRFITDGYDTEVTTDEEVILLKGPWHFGLYKEVIKNPDRIFNVLEFGIFEGGSAILFAEMFPQAKIVGIDMRAPSPAVARHIERAGLKDRVRLYYGVMQDNGEAIAKIIREEFGASDLDLLIDDCSHQYGFTRSSFEIVYPKLKTGGIYALEDWDWAHHRSNVYRHWSSPVLSNFVYELIAGLTSSRDVMSEARIFRGLALFTKGTHKGPLKLNEVVYADRAWPKL